MKNTRCYGKNKVIVPKEKSFITNFFDGNESSDLFVKGPEIKDGASASGFRETMYHIFDSPFSFSGTFPLEQKTRSRVRSVAKPTVVDQGYSSENKENACNLFESPDNKYCDESFSRQKKSFGVRNVPKAKQAPKNRVNKRKYVKKKVNLIQHLSTKYCKSLQPHWDEFEKHDLNIERQGKTDNPIIIKESTRLKNIKNHTTSVYIANNSNCGETMSRLHISTPKILQSSGELFVDRHKYKTNKKRKNLKTKNIKTKKTKSRKKNDDEISYEMVTRLVENIVKSVQNVNLSETSIKNVDSHSKSFNCKGKTSNVDSILPSNCRLHKTIPIKCSKAVSKASNVDSILPNDSAVQETVPIQCSKANSHDEIIPKSKDFCSTVDEISKNNTNKESVSASEMHNISSNNGYSKSLMHNAAYSKKNVECSTYSPQKLPHVFNNNVHSNNDLSPSKFIGLCEDRNITDISDKATLCDSKLETVSYKSQELLSENVRILQSVDSDIPYRLRTRNISGKAVCINENEQNFIQSKPSDGRKINDSMSSIDLPHESKHFGKSSGVSDSLKLKEKTLKNLVCKNDSLNAHTLSPNVSNIIQNKSFGIKGTGKFVTSTPLTSRTKAHNFFNAEMIALSNDENLCEPNTHSKHHSSSCDKAKENKHLKPLKTETLKESSINSLYESPSSEIRKSLQCSVTPNLLKSRTSLTVPSKNLIISETHKNIQSLLNLSSINSLSEKEKSDDFTKDKLLKLCDQDSVTPFADIYDWKNFKVKKIGEGTYGEVFMLSKGKTSSVLKVIAISEDPNVKNLQGLSSVYSEVKISKSLSELRCNQINQSKNFVKVIRSSVAYGLYPDALMKAWDDFSMDRSTYNYRPDIYGENQLFVILELEYGGNDMSCFTLRNAVEAEIILKQIAVSLAVAEDEFSFEHRDLHLGNILVKRNRSKKVSYKIRGKDISFQCHGLQVTIIDFTLSLLSDRGYIYYYDLAEDSLFDQTGDYQFDVYKSMRRHLENKWEECSLYSNVLWLKYLCKKLKEFKYTHPSAVTHKRGLKAIDSFNFQLMKCSCALECLEKCGITKTAFKRSISDSTRNSILVSRNSIQKSKLSLCN